MDYAHLAAGERKLKVAADGRRRHGSAGGHPLRSGDDERGRRRHGRAEKRACTMALRADATIDTAEAGWQRPARVLLTGGKEDRGVVCDPVCGPLFNLSSSARSAGVGGRLIGRRRRRPDAGAARGKICL